MADMKIVLTDITKIIPYWRNPRKNDDAVKAVKASIEKYGINSPILLDSAGVIIAGHTRYKALLELGYKQVPCVFSAMDQKKAKEFRIVDNKVGEVAAWDADMLKLELREFDISASIPGFSDAELEAMFPTQSASNEDILEELPAYEEEPDTTGMEDADAEKEMEAYNERRKEALEVQARALEKQRIEIEREKAAFAKKEKEMADRFSNQSERTQSDYVECTCPNCGEDFMLDKREVAR